MSAGRWSLGVTGRTNALDLDKEVFTRDDPRSIALSLKQSAEHSRGRRGTPFQSAMSMLTFYINRAGKDLPAERKNTLEKAKEELRAAFGR